MAAHNELGKWGEAFAADYLQREGYVVMNRDWKFGRRDLDIVAMTPDRQTLAFIEVKTRRNNTFIEPQQAVDYAKQRSLAIAANAYVKAYRINQDIRFDIIAITGTSAADARVEHIEDAFTPYF